MNRSWVRFPQAAQIRPPGSGWAFLYALTGRAAWCARGRRPASLMALLVAPRVFRAPEAPAAREARRPHFVRCRASKPARALRSLRRPSHRWGLVADAWFGASSRSLARPRRRLRAPQPGPAFCSSPVPSGPSGALHTSGAGSLMCALRVDSLSGRAPLHSGAARPCNLRRSRRPHSTFRTGGDGGFAALGGGWRRVAGVSHP